MFKKHLERLQRSMPSESDEEPARGVHHTYVSNEEFFRRHRRTADGGIGIKVIKHA